MDVKQILKDIKARFSGEVAPPVAPVAPAAAAVTTAKIHKLQDGTEISISQAGEVPAMGDLVTIGGLPATEGTYTLEDGAVIVVDLTGMITAYTPAVALAAPPVPPVAPPAAPAQPVTLSAEEVQAMYAKFATGSTEDRLGNLETMIKALMECSFGYEIRKTAEQEAILAYKESVAQQFAEAKEASEKKIAAQETTIAKHEETIKGLFELVEKLVELPTADPVTLTEGQKAKFERQNFKEERLKKIAEAMKKQKALA